MDTEELRKLLDEATPGPWLATYSNYGDEIWFGGEGCGMWEVGPAYLGGNGNATELKATMDADARLIALAPTLAAENIAMRADIANLTASLAAEVTQSQNLRRAGDRMVAVASEARIVLAEHEPHPLPILGRFLEALAAWEAAQ